MHLQLHRLQLWCGAICLSNRAPARVQLRCPGQVPLLTLRLCCYGREYAEHDPWWNEKCAEALRYGHKLYVGEGCWHCHSQYVRPVAHEDTRFGPVSRWEQDNNALQRPVLWGTRRVGPDLTYEGTLRSNDWHAAHFWDPGVVSPGSVMPARSFRIVFCSGLDRRDLDMPFHTNFTLKQAQNRASRRIEYFALRESSRTVSIKDIISFMKFSKLLLFRFT